MRRSSASIRSMGVGGSAFLRLRVMPRKRSTTAHQATPGECLVDNHDAAQVEDRTGLLFLEPLQARLQLLNAFQLELSEQGKAGALTLRGDVKLDRHLLKPSAPLRESARKGEG
jgi:hypothetical protein